MALIELVEKQADGDLVCEMLAFAAERIMEAEVEARTGAAKGARTPMREVLIYTTNAIEALKSKIRRAVRTRGHFPSDDAAAKLIYLALNATSDEWKRSVREWHAVRSQLAIMFEDHFPMA